MSARESFDCDKLIHRVGNRVRRCELDVSGSGWELVAGSCEYGNESSGCIKGRNFLTS
jgi:hypothetical protein